MDSRRDNPNAAFLGRGWRFPPAFGVSGATVQTVDGAEDVHEAVQIILKTEVGERVLRETFGCALNHFMFEEIDHRLFGRIRTTITNAILDHEPRIALDAVDITESPDEPGLLLITLQYTIRSTNTRYNMVYPFYTKEASAAAR